MKYSDDYTERLINNHSSAVYRAALSYMGDSHDAEDIMQEVFIRLWKASPEFSDTGHERAWLLRVTVNCCKSALVSRSRRREVLTDRCELFTAGSAGARDNSVLQAVLSLPPKMSICIHLFYYEDMSIEEVSRTTGMLQNTVKSNLRRAREKLGEILKEEYGNVEKV